MITLPPQNPSLSPLTVDGGKPDGEDQCEREIGEAMILAELQRQGQGNAITFGHDLPFDLIVVRKEDGALEKV